MSGLAELRERVKLTPEQKRRAECAMWTTLFQSESTSFFELYRAANIATGFPEYDQHSPCYRAADGFLQRLRRKRFAAPKRYGGVWTWSLTPAGRAALLSPGGADAG